MSFGALILGETVVTVREDVLERDAVSSSASDCLGWSGWSGWSVELAAPLAVSVEDKELSKLVMMLSDVKEQTERQCLWRGKEVAHVGM